MKPAKEVVSLHPMELLLEQGESCATCHQIITADNSIGVCECAGAGHECCLASKITSFIADEPEGCVVKCSSCLTDISYVGKREYKFKCKGENCLLIVICVVILVLVVKNLIRLVQNTQYHFGDVLTFALYILVEIMGFACLFYAVMSMFATKRIKIIQVIRFQGKTYCSIVLNKK